MPLLAGAVALLFAGAYFGDLLEERLAQGGITTAPGGGRSAVTVALALVAAGWFMARR